jgi:signal transduction histidine kinase/CheY-like chemotaxis protein
MSKPILTLEIRVEHDVVLARQRARQLAGLLGFEPQDQTRIATSVSEIARNAYQYAGGGRVEFLFLDGSPLMFMARIRDSGPGIRDVRAILSGQYVSATGMGIGLIGVRRLMDHFHIESMHGGTLVELGKILPRRAISEGPDLARISEELARRGPSNPFEEIQQQNQDMLRTLEELHERQAELERLNGDLEREREALARVNRELEDTNRGVVALYAELDEKADFLRRASEMKSRFLANMSHEFRTPLNSITGLSRLLLDRTDGDLTAEQDKQVRLIRKAAEDLTELVNDLLDLAKVEAGKVAVRPVEFDVGALFGALRGMLRPLLAHNASVALVFEEPAGLPLLNTDEGKVSQILRNFISNALKFTEHGEVRVSARLEDDNVNFSVTDTGIGIPSEDHERIFEEFTQLDGPRQRGAKGTGLGLPLVKKLVGLLGGRVELKSTPGNGSTFSAILPCVFRGPVEVTFVPDVTTHIDPERQPVLIVEDNRETLFIYEKYLKGTGFQVMPAHTVKAARAALGAFRPVAIVLDVLLEGENTWEFLADLKRGQSTRTIPVYVITMVENEHKALALGADGFCTKPVDRAWLLDRLNRLAVPFRAERVLIIDDDEASRYILKGLLADAHLVASEAATGADGVRRARQDAPRAVFLDLDLPDQSGLEVLADLRADPRTQNVPVIIHTSQVLAEDGRRRLAEAGALAVLPKESALQKARLPEVLRQAGLGAKA